MLQFCFENFLVCKYKLYHTNSTTNKNYKDLQDSNYHINTFFTIHLWSAIFGSCFFLCRKRRFHLAGFGKTKLIFLWLFFYYVVVLFGLLYNVVRKIFTFLKWMELAALFALWVFSIFLQVQYLLRYQERKIVKWLSNMFVIFCTYCK